MKTPFSWDYNSDQPYQLKDRIFKKHMRKQERASLLKTALYGAFILPLSLLALPFTPKRTIDTNTFFGMSVNLDKDIPTQVEAIKELHVKNLLIRIPLWEMERVGEYVAFVENFEHLNITLNIMQDREHIEDTKRLLKDLNTLFFAFENMVEYFQIGTTINRAKWGFFSVDEYITFFQIAQDVASMYQNIHLIGPSVIDFEYHFSAHALFSQRHFHFDGTSALLYVDRRGAPENSQMGFNLLRKIRLLNAMMHLSGKTAQKLFITETNWPLSNTAPYAPTSEYECVSEESAANFMLRYYLIALGSQQVETLFFHQLIANGYGLMDARERPIRKRLAYSYFKVMVELLQGLDVVSYSMHPYHTLTCKNEHTIIKAYWSNTERHTLTCKADSSYIDALGEPIHASDVVIGKSVLYEKVKS